MCPEKHVVFRKTVARRTLTDGEIKTLLLNGPWGLFPIFTSKKGKPFQRGSVLTRKET